MATQYTYDDFVKKATDAGLMGNFSQYDLDVAKQHPEFGLSILSLKQDNLNAKTDEARALANQAANELRQSYGNYSGGADGSQYIAGGLTPSSYQSAYQEQIDGLLGQIGNYQSPYQANIDSLLGQIGNYGAFSYDKAAPTYTNQYQSTIDSLLDQIVNREDFSYDKDQDPAWSAYKKQYRREGDRATANALGQASAASGGLPSSYAVNAATQAGDYYAAQLSDMIPTLYQQAYDRYLNEYQMKQSALASVNTQEQNDYQKYLTDLGQYNTDRNFAYNEYQNAYNRLLDGLGAYQTQDSTEYARLLDALGAYQGQDSTEYSRLLDQVNYNTQQTAARADAASAAQTLAQNQVDAILSAGGSPSDSLLSASGYSSEYAQALEAYYRQQALAAAYSGGKSGGGSGGGSSGGSQASGDSDIYSTMRGQGITTEGQAYAWLLSQGYSSTNAKALTGYYMDYLSKSQANSRYTNSGVKASDLLTASAFLKAGLTAGTTMEEATEKIAAGVNSGKLSDTEASSLLKMYGF